MAKKTEAQRERERRAKLELEPPVPTFPEGHANRVVAQREAKQRHLGTVGERIAAMAGRKVAPGAKTKFGQGSMASSVKKRA